MWAPISFTKKIRQDPRVISIEQQHILKCDVGFWNSRNVPLPFDLFVTDLSFISLTKVISHCLPWLAPSGHWVLLVKPQFELEPSKVPKGVVKDPQFVQEAIDKILSYIKNQEGLVYQDLIESPIKGTEGNREYLLWLKKI